MSEQGRLKLPEIIPFNADNSTPYDKPEEGTYIDVHGGNERIHHTNNLVMIIGIYDKFSRGEPLDNPFEQVYEQVFAENNIARILERLCKDHQGLYDFMAKSSREFLATREELNNTEMRFGKQSPEYQSLAAQHRHTDEEKAEITWGFSMGWDAIANCAHAVDSSYDRRNLWPLLGYSAPKE
jgi:hypothetical protein